MKYWLVILAIALSSSASFAQGVRIGYIDMQRIIRDSAAGKRASERFQAQVKKAEADTLKERQDFERLKTEYDKKAPLLKEEERRNLESDLQRRSVSLQRTMSDLQQDLQQKEREMMGDILKDLEQIIADVGKSEKFTVILERSQLLFGDQSVDITAKVIDTYNSRAKK